MKKLMSLLLLCVLWTGVAAGNPDGEVRNVIYMIGDGMGLAQVSMLQVENDYAPTAFQRAQHIGLAITRSANNRVTDSAAAGTALATGHKTNNGMLGRTPDGEDVQSMMAYAHADGMATGIVVTCYLQHATPAAFYAHVDKRDQTENITRDLLACDYDVLIGGGRKWLSEECAAGGSYLDAFRSKGYTVVDDLSQAEGVRSGRLLGAVADEHLPKAEERGNFLAQATNKALEILSADAGEKGFLLMVEGSQIDYACHANDAKWLVDEMRDFDKAIAAAMDFADRTPGTLVVIVADHETGGLSVPSGKADFRLAESGIEYKFSTGGHSGSMVPIYLYGAGAEKIAGIMENTKLAERIMETIGVGK